MVEAKVSFVVFPQGVRTSAKLSRQLVTISGSSVYRAPVDAEAELVVEAAADLALDLDLIVVGLLVAVAVEEDVVELLLPPEVDERPRRARRGRDGSGRRDERRARAAHVQLPIGDLDSEDTTRCTSPRLRPPGASAKAAGGPTRDPLLLQMDD